MTETIVLSKRGEKRREKSYSANLVSRVLNEWSR